ncbi:TetR/AcrR family transcriptional regulator [Kitasatospora viridis]|uniref:TetR family transcriptional regulator n=1 Tax=Kitasatospora viridis TaxID=281105 RepID=A0A561T657_9ACTN|nr:TetR/AcrR family transcriptional regulator [Kitasatospora viridis]TWF82596.1 TetR family transcriptional regulator [Kitasatospora viridis]
MAEDRRTRRTRRALRDALVALILERGYTGLTVEDIAERADVARATFYSHYRDKDDLFTKVTGDLLRELDERLHPLAEETGTGFTGKPLLELFRHAEEERDLYRVILRGEGDGKALRTFGDESVRRVAAVFTARAEHSRVAPRIPADLLARAWVGEQLAVLHWWLEQDTPPMPAAEAARMLLDLAIHGRYWASGLTPPAS